MKTTKGNWLKAIKVRVATWQVNLAPTSSSSYRKVKNRLADCYKAYQWTDKLKILLIPTLMGKGDRIGTRTNGNFCAAQPWMGKQVINEQ